MLCGESFAGQLTGSLAVSLTVLKRCEISLRSDKAAWYVQGDGCEYAAFRVEDGQGRALPLSSDNRTAPLRLEGSESLEVYW